MPPLLQAPGLEVTCLAARCAASAEAMREFCAKFSEFVLDRGFANLDPNEHDPVARDIFLCEIIESLKAQLEPIYRGTGELAETAAWAFGETLRICNDAGCLTEEIQKHYLENETVVRSLLGACRDHLAQHTELLKSSTSADEQFDAAFNQTDLMLVLITRDPQKYRDYLSQPLRTSLTKLLEADCREDAERHSLQMLLGTREFFLGCALFQHGSRTVEDAGYHLMAEGLQATAQVRDAIMRGDDFSYDCFFYPYVFTLWRDASLTAAPAAIGALTALIKDQDNDTSVKGKLGQMRTYLVQAVSFVFHELPEGMENLARLMIERGLEEPQELLSDVSPGALLSPLNITLQALVRGIRCCTNDDVPEAMEARTIISRLLNEKIRSLNLNSQENGIRFNALARAQPEFLEQSISFSGLAEFYRTLSNLADRTPSDAEAASELTLARYCYGRAVWQVAKNEGFEMEDLPNIAAPEEWQQDILNGIGVACARDMKSLLSKKTIDELELLRLKERCIELCQALYPASGDYACLFPRLLTTFMRRSALYVSPGSDDGNAEVQAICGIASISPQTFGRAIIQRLFSLSREDSEAVVNLAELARTFACNGDSFAAELSNIFAKAASAGKRPASLARFLYTLCEIPETKNPVLQAVVQTFTDRLPRL